jgi:hypothetical protein
MAIAAGVRLATRDGSFTELDEQTVQAFAASLRGRLLLPGDPGYDEGRLLWNGMHDKRLAALKAKYDPTNLFRMNLNITPRA